MARWQAERADWGQRQAGLEAQVAQLQEQLLTALTRQPEQYLPSLPAAQPAAGMESLHEALVGSTAQVAPAAPSASAANMAAAAALKPLETAAAAGAAPDGAAQPARPLTTASVDAQIWSAINAVSSTDVLRSDHDYLAAPFAGQRPSPAGASGQAQAHAANLAPEATSAGQSLPEAAGLPSAPGPMAEQLAGVRTQGSPYQNLHCREDTRPRQGGCQRGGRIGAACILRHTLNGLCHQRTLQPLQAWDDAAARTGLCEQAAGHTPCCLLPRAAASTYAPPHARAGTCRSWAASGLTYRMCLCGRALLELLLESGVPPVLGLPCHPQAAG